MPQVVGHYCRRWIAEDLAAKLCAVREQAKTLNAEFEAADKKS